MIKRLLWFAIGAAVAVFVIKKVRAYVRKSSPQAVGQRVADSAGTLGSTARTFTERVRAAMAEREAELSEALGLPQEPESDER